MPEKFIIRVYGLLIDVERGVLVADEMEAGQRFTKFPGGGLEWGEGTHDCLIREWKEELGQDIIPTEHFYTTDFFQVSAFNKDYQVLSIYYLIKTIGEPQIPFSVRKFDFKEETNGAESFRWITLNDFHEDLLTFPIDRHVAKLIRNKF
ncbi:MAG: NUDIX domain-containing protein [Chitinophagales bacterium]|nr:NUDIX domain-containing protein [Chitinophagales bacterium]